MNQGTKATANTLRMSTTVERSIAFELASMLLSETAQVQYKCTDVYRPGDEIGVVWNDPEIGIAWPVADPVLNEKDRKAPRLADIVQKLRSV